MKWNPYFFSYYAKKIYVFVKENFFILFLFSAFSLYMTKEIYHYFYTEIQTDTQMKPSLEETVLENKEYSKESLPQASVKEKSALNFEKEEKRTEDKICVFLSGNVHQSGKYFLSLKERTLKDLLLKAGGMKEDYSDFLFMEKILKNNESYYLPSAEALSEVLSKIKKGKYPWWWKKDLYRLEEEEEKGSLENTENTENTENCLLTEGIEFQSFPERISELPLNERQKTALKEYLKNHKIEKLEDFLQVEGIGEKSLQKLQAFLIYEIS